MILSELSLVLDVTEKKECIFILVLFTEKKPQGYKPEIPKNDISHTFFGQRVLLICKHVLLTGHSSMAIVTTLYNKDCFP